MGSLRVFNELRKTNIPINAIYWYLFFATTVFDFKLQAAGQAFRKELESDPHSSPFFITFNLKDFPLAVMQPYGIEVQHPDEFIANQMQLQKIRALSAIKEMRARWTNPARSAQELIKLVSCAACL